MILELKFKISQRENNTRQHFD